MNIRIAERVLRAFFIFVFIVGTIWVPASPAIAAGGEYWLKLSPSGTVPEIRYWHGGVYDSISDRMIVFGGGSYGHGNLNDVWVLTNANGLGTTPEWINTIPNGQAGSPPSRNLPGTTYDPVSNRLIIFGGCGGGCYPTLNDVWVLTNANSTEPISSQWIQLFPSGTPPSPRDASLINYDPATNRMIVFSGHNGSGSSYTYDDVWVLTNANGTEANNPQWIQISSNIPVAGRYLGAAVYDQLNNRLITFGGKDIDANAKNAVWVLTHANGLGGTPEWINILPENPAGLPSPNAGHSAVYDSTTNSMTVFSGSTQVSGLETLHNAVWRLSYANGLGGTPVWTQILPDGTAPSPRSNSTLGYDAANQRLVLFGGHSSELNADSWILDFTPTPPLLPSSFYGEIHINDGAPAIGDKVEAYLPGMTGVAASGTITTYLGNLVYSFDVPGTADTEGDLITFKINGRVVATGIWHSGTHVALNIHPPAALPGGPYTGNEGSAISFNGSANDWGGDATTYEWDWDNDGTFDTTGQNPSRVFAQDGAYTVGLRVTDAQGGVGSATVIVNVNNVAPTVNAGDDFTVAEDATFNFAGSASDPADVLTYEWDFNYDGTTFDVDASGSLTPSHAYPVVGTHTAALRVHDDDTTVIDTVVVTVTNVNDVPVITGQKPLATDEDTPLTIALGDLTVEDPDNTYPADFTLTVLPGTNYTVNAQTITPALNFNGILTVPAKVNDGLADSNTFDLTVTVNPVNDTPVADPQSLATDEDTPLSITLTGSDVETVSLAYAVTVNPAHGTLSGTAPNLVYTPALDYSGADSFKFTVSDGVLTSAEATVTIAVNAVNDAPVITGQSALSVNEDTSLTINLTDLSVTDVDNTYPAGFSLIVLDGANYTHAGNAVTPAHNFHGALTVPVQVNDGAADSTVFDLAVTVIDVLPTNPDAGGPYNAVSGQPVTLTGSATCEPADDCVFTWDLDYDGEYDDATGGSTTHTWYTVGTYTVGMKVTDNDGNSVTASAAVNISAVTHSVNLVTGWNLVSFNLHPTDTNVAQVLASVAGNYDLVYAWDATGAHPESGNWLKYDNIPFTTDSLTTLDEKVGFWIHMTAPDVLEVAGSIPTTTQITLSDNAGGWNLVGYPSAAGGTLPAILSDNGVGTDFTLVYAYHAGDASDPWKLFDRNVPPFFNDLTQLTPGWGYWVKVSADHPWMVEYVP